MKIAIMHGEVAKGAGPDEQDGLAEVAFVSEVLARLGHETGAVSVSLNLEESLQQLSNVRPALVFNLVESLSGKGSLIHLAPSLLDALGIPYTGARTEAMFLTSNKLLAKRTLAGAGLPTPPWVSKREKPKMTTGPGIWIVKSLWEHASVGLDEESVFFAAEQTKIIEEMAARKKNLGGSWLAERFIEGREFNVSLIAGDDTTPKFKREDSVGGAVPLPEQGNPLVLPPAEIRFDGYPPGKVRVVGYRAKWEVKSFEYAATTRSFAFPPSDAPLLARLKELALACWRLFELRGYARVDFRVDAAGRPWILEVNANPCLSPGAGFLAAAAQINMSHAEALSRIINDAA
ncbi:MAG: D-alanine--D-alanine ligase [Syntrophobacterales bacterium]|nr:D-alanine--D-alanine ligase [Syntrophobacterales bacterium]